MKRGPLAEWSTGHSKQPEVVLCWSLCHHCTFPDRLLRITLQTYTSTLLQLYSAPQHRSCACVDPTGSGMSILAFCNLPCSAGFIVACLQAGDLALQRFTWRPHSTPARLMISLNPSVELPAMVFKLLATITSLMTQTTPALAIIIPSGTVTKTWPTHCQTQMRSSARARLPLIEARLQQQPSSGSICASRSHITGMKSSKRIHRQKLRHPRSYQIHVSRAQLPSLQYES